MTVGILAVTAVGVMWTIYGNVMGQAPKRNLCVPALIFCTMGIAAVISFTAGLIQGVPHVSRAAFIFAMATQIIAGIINYLQLEFMSRAMQRGNNGIVWSVVQSGFVFPFFMGIIFFGVPLTWLKLLALISLLAGIIFFGIAQGGQSRGKWFLPTLIAFLSTGFCQIFNNLPSYYEDAASVSSLWKTGAISLGFVLGALGHNIFNIKDFTARIAENCRIGIFWKYCAMLLTVDFPVNFFLLYPGMNMLAAAGAGAIACPIMVCSSFLSFDLFSLLVLKEKHTILQWTALFLCIAGGVILCS